ncbi:hypothetical protein BDV3_005205 [Batrachochytrium dendrobatidis]
MSSLLFQLSVFGLDWECLAWLPVISVSESLVFSFELPTLYPFDLDVVCYAFLQISLCPVLLTFLVQIQDPYTHIP